MKIKRWVILTALFAVLGGTIVASGCQTTNTASTNNTLTAGSSLSDCIISCTNACIEECPTAEECTGACSKTCTTFNPFAISCNGDPIQYCFDCTCAFGSQCGEILDDSANN